MNKKITGLLCGVLAAVISAGICFAAETEAVTEVDQTQTLVSAELEDGIYQAQFDTDNGMFRINEVYDGKGLLFVEDGEMRIHITLLSKNIVNLFPGTSEEAKAEDAHWLDPTLDTVTYSDGYTETVYGFEVPVPVLEEEFDLALIGKKNKWYDHKVSVSDVQPIDEKIVEEIMNTWETTENQE